MPAGSVRQRHLSSRRVLTTSLVGLTLGVLGVLGVLGATSAQAHNVLRSTDPADGSTVAVAPAQVTLTFDEPALALGTEIEVRDPAGTLVSAGSAVLVDNTVAQQLVGELPAGRYTVAWRVTSADGHPITGQLAFTTTGATTVGGAPAARPTASPTDAAGAQSSGTSAASAALVAAGVVVVAVVGWVLWRRGRSRSVSAGD